MKKVSLWKRLKEIWKVPRYRALITLGFYIIFFLLVYLYVISVENSTPAVKNNSSATNPFMKSVQSYEYIYDIVSVENGASTTLQILGTYVDKVDTLMVNSHTFYNQNNVIYSKEEGIQMTDFVPIDIGLLTPTNLSLYLQNEYLDTKVTYKNGDSKSVFRVPASEFNIAYLQNIDPNLFVLITVYSNQNQNISIQLDIYEVMKMVLPTIEKYTIDITYKNINAIQKVETGDTTLMENNGLN